MADGDGGKTERDERLAAALKENLRRRKAQARGRRAGGADERQGLAAARPADTEKPESGR